MPDLLLVTFNQNLTQIKLYLFQPVIVYQVICILIDCNIFRPSTPIFDLLEHKYQDKWLQQRRQLEVAKRTEENKVTRQP